MTSEPVLTTRKPVALAFWGSRLRDRQHMTIGDVYSVQAIYRGLARRGLPARILFEGERYPGSSVQIADPSRSEAADFSAFAFVCGPLHAYGSTAEFFDSFRTLPRLALNVSEVSESAGAEKHFDTIVWRDSHNLSTFDIAIDPRGCEPARSGLSAHRSGFATCFVADQPEYGPAGARSSQAKSLILDALARIGEAEPASLSTLTAGRPLSDIERDFQKPQLVVTTRLHASLFAIRNGAAVVSIDQIAGGAKVQRIIGRELGWPCTYRLDELTCDSLVNAIEAAQSMPSERLSWFRRRAEALAGAASDHMCAAIATLVAANNRA